MSIKNMAYWRAKNGCASKGSYDGKSPDLKANRSPMRMDPMTAMTIASTLKDAKGKEDSKGLDIMSMSPTPQKSSPAKQVLIMPENIMPETRLKSDYTDFIPYTKTEMQQYAEPFLQPIVQPQIISPRGYQEKTLNTPQQFPELRPIMKHIIPDYHTVKEDGVERLISTYPKSLAYDPTYERRSKLGQLGTRIANIFRSDEKDKNVKVRKRK